MKTFKDWLLEKSLTYAKIRLWGAAEIEAAQLVYTLITEKEPKQGKDWRDEVHADKMHRSCPLFDYKKMVCSVDGAKIENVDDLCRFK